MHELSYEQIVTAGVLKVITDMFLPHMGLSELEDGCFSKILPKVNNRMNAHCHPSHNM